MHTITINGKRHPIKMTMAALKRYSMAKGLSDMQEAFKLFSTMAQEGENLSFETLDNLSLLVYESIKEGRRISIQEGFEVPENECELDDATNAIFENMELLNVIIQDMIPTAKKEEPKGKKK